jgi:hypothetical protein
MNRWLPVVLIFIAAACGGGSEPPPGPLKHTVQDMYIASVPVEMKGSVVSTKQEYDIAQMEQAKVESDLSQVKTQIQIAANEDQASDLRIKSAKAEEEAALKSADLNKQEEAKRSLFAAEQGKKATKAKVAWHKAENAYLEKQLRFRQHETFAKEAAWQLEKARVARNNNIRPSGFDYNEFETQAIQRRDAASRARMQADGLRSEAESKKRAYETAEMEAKQAGVPF